MCTAVTFQTNDHYFGRNLDLEYAYDERVTITPRNFPFQFRHQNSLDSHYAIIGMATVDNGYPLYYDATNEHGLSIAGLNFPGNAVYYPIDHNKNNIAPFELIPWLLGQCRNLKEARQQLENINICDTSYSQQFPLTPLHWVIADKTGSVTLETLKDGMRIYENPTGVLTNNPPFEYHMHNLTNYLNVTREEPTNRMTDKLSLSPYSRGMGAMGLPGDLSSPSRFVRAVFTKFNSVCKADELSSVTQFFHILGSVEQQEGCVKVNNAFEKTVYSSCCNADKGIYYYTTYENSQITAIDLHNEQLDSSILKEYPLKRSQQILFEN